MDVNLRGSLAGSRVVAVAAAGLFLVASGGVMTASATIESGEKGAFVPITPCRVMDTRVAPVTVGGRSTPIGAGETHTIAVRGSNGNCTIPTDAVGLSMNVTIVNPTAPSFLTVFPSGAQRPLASNLNYTAGDPPVPNAVTVRIGADGRISFYNNGGTVDVVADIVGYFADHNHNDLYYTKAQIDTALALKANTPVTGAQILDGTVALADLADNSVNSAKVVNDSLTAVDLGTDSVTATEIADNSIDSGEIQDFSLTNEDINVFYARVSGAGAIVASSSGVTSSRQAQGDFLVDFNRPLTTCGWSSTSVFLGETHTFTTAQADVLEVHVHSSDGTASFDQEFNLVVVC